MLTLDEARALLGGAVAPLAPVSVALEEACGLVLAEAPASDLDLPPADVSAMDGYAVRAADLEPGRVLPVAATVPAGSHPPALAAGAAARIFTGAELPAGADTVVPQEQAAPVAGGVRLEVLPAGSHRRRRGEVLAAGAPLGRPGQRVTPQRLALLAAGGAASVRVVPRPAVAILTTGAELVPHHGRPGPGQIRDSNGPMLVALAREAGLAVRTPARVPDEPGATRRALAEAARSAELVVVSGGVSVGDFDLVPAAVVALRGEVVLHKVAVQPGKPVLVARVGDSWLVGLPGNAVSSLVSWRMFARPLAETLAGDAGAFGEQPVHAVLERAVSSTSRRTQLLPAARAAGGTVAVVPWKGSHDLGAAAAADCLARVEPGASLAAGTPVPLYPLPWREGPASP